MPAPIALFTYNRIDTLKLTLASLKLNRLATDSDLYIFSDGPKNADQSMKVEAVRSLLKSVNGFRKVVVIESQTNKGLAASIISGVSSILEEHESVIVLEDDLLTASNFLDFMNEALDFYALNHEIISVSGYSMTVKKRNDDKNSADVFFALRGASWGWATWANRWVSIDWSVADFTEFSADKKKINEFNKMGSDMFSMLKNQQMGKNNSWAIRFCYHQFKNNLYTVYPFVSKVKNIGFGSSATHTTQTYNRFDVNLDLSNASTFSFSHNVTIDARYIKQFARINGFWKRLESKVRNFLK